MKRIEQCANCGKDIDVVEEGFYRCLDNFLQLRYFEAIDGSDNIFCSSECACEALMIETVHLEINEVEEEEEEEYET